MKKLKLQNLDCANCALKIEKTLNNMPELSNVRLNFSTSTLTFEQNIDKDLSDLIEKEIQKIEKEVIIVKEESKNQKRFWQNLDKKLLFITFLSLFLTYISYNYIENRQIQITVFLIAYIIVAWDVLYKAFKNIIVGKVFDEYFLMSIATIGAIALFDFVEAIAVMVFYQVGEMFQRVAVNNSRDSINALIDIKPEFAFVKEGEAVVQKTPQELKLDDVILVKVGEKVPVDAILLENSCSFDTSAITGEFKPKTLKQNEEVLSGYINVSNAVYLKVKSLYKDSTIAKVIELIENASLKKANAEKFITKFASVYTPIVVVLALFLAFLPPLFIENALYSDWIERALVFLVISCPCALVISVPLSYFSAIGAVSKKGVLVKGANYIEKLTEIKNFVFDKTGTLTKGVFEVTKVEAFDMSKDELLRVVATVESFSTHPIAKAVVKECKEELNLKELSFSEEFSGLGIKAIVNEKEILVGNRKLLEKFGIKISQNLNESLNIVYISINSKFVGYIVVSDVIKSEAKEFLKELKKLNILKTYMLTGDKKEQALEVAKNIGIDEVRYELLPQDKLKIYENIKKDTNQTTAFVGDGINDAPTLANADIGFAMGGIGSDLAIKSADVIVLNDNLNSISDAIKIAKKTKVIFLFSVVVPPVATWPVTAVPFHDEDVGASIFCLLSLRMVNLFMFAGWMNPVIVLSPDTITSVMDGVPAAYAFACLSSTIISRAMALMFPAWIADPHMFTCSLM